MLRFAGNVVLESSHEPAGNIQTHAHTHTHKMDKRCGCLPFLKGDRRARPEGRDPDASHAPTCGAGRCLPFQHNLRGIGASHSQEFRTMAMTCVVM